MEVIKSKDNKLLKHFRKLKIKKCRQESNEFMIEGIRIIEEAVSAGAGIKYCLCSEELDGDRVKSLLKGMKDKNIKIYMVDSKLINDICDTENPQGIVAVIEKKKYEEEELFKNSDYLVVVDRIQDPGNLGTIIRTADAAGAHGIIISDGTVDPYSPKVLRSTMGSIFHVPVIFATDMIKAIDMLKARDFSVYVSSLEGSVPYHEEDYTGKTVIVIGNEANGVSSSIIHRADRLIKILMPGKAESLNAGIAGGILMFEVVKQRMAVDK